MPPIFQTGTRARSSRCTVSVGGWSITSWDPGPLTSRSTGTSIRAGTAGSTGPRTASLSTDDGTLAIASTVPLTIVPPGTHRLAVWSPAYGVIEPAPVVTARKTASLPMTIASFIPATSELADALDIEEAVLDATPGHGWRSSAFRVRWSGGTMTWLGAVETSGLASSDSASPRSQWGTAEFHTDARIAVLLDRVGGASEVILVNGTLARARNRQIVSLASRVPLRRFAFTSRARNMHEVGAGLHSD